MRKEYLIILFTAICSVISVAQNKTYNDDAVLMTIGNSKITKGEFTRIYNKNNNNSDIKSVDEYVTLFENFKLKVIEAENMGLDTLIKFKRELKGYVRQLEKPYFTDSLIDDKLIKEAFGRSKNDVRVAHVLIKVAPDASPRDTLRAYNKLKTVLNSIKSGKMTFGKAAKDNSDDTYTAKNDGDLGFFTVFQMVYNFESAAFNTKIGDVSNIFRTKFGYHILKVKERRKALGQVKVAHIMMSVPTSANDAVKLKAKDKINDIYNKLQKGERFIELAMKNSDDKGSAPKGGELDWFGTGRMVPAFEIAAFNLKNKNDYTKPVKTQFGWHIIKLIDKKEPKSLEDQREYVKGKLSKDARAEQSMNAVLARLSREYKLKLTLDPLKKVYKFYDINNKDNIRISDSIANSFTNKDILFTLADTTIYLKDFTQYLVENVGRGKKTNKPDAYVFDKFEVYKERTIMNYEKTQLASKYPDFKYLVKEYHDGILLFDLTDNMVWSKAVKDTSGLEIFYNKTKDKYKWGERFDAIVYSIPEKYGKKAKKMAKKMSTVEEAIASLKKIAKGDTISVFNVQGKKFSKGDNEKVDNAGIEKGLVELESLKGVSKFVYIKGKLAPMPKELNEIKGLMTADYQNYLEKEWIKELRTKYEISVNKEVLKSIK